MLDIKWIRENPEAFDEGMRKREHDASAAELLKLDDSRRDYIARLQDAQTRITIQKLELS